MRELAEQAEELMVKRVQELRDEFGMSRSKTYDLEVKEYVARMDRILHTLSEEASSFSPLPRDRLKLAAPPMPHIREMAVQVMVRGKATLVAAFPSIPTLLPM